MTTKRKFTITTLGRLLPGQAFAFHHEWGTANFRQFLAVGRRNGLIEFYDFRHDLYHRANPCEHAAKKVVVAVD